MPRVLRSRYTSIAIALLLATACALSFAPGSAHAQAQQANPPTEGAQSPDVLLKQGLAAREAKNHAEAIGYFAKVLAIMEGSLGREHADLVPLLDALGAAHRELKQYPQALVYFQRSLQIDEKTLGANHVSVASDLREVAGIYRSMGDGAKAAPLYERAITILENAPKPNYSTISIVQATAGSLFAEMKEYAKALDLYQRALVLFEKIHGPEHEQLVTPLNLIGNLYRDSREDTKAIPVYERSIAIQRKSKGEENMLFAVTANNLAISLQQSGQFAQALPWYLRSIAIREKLLGAEHESVATALANLATVQRELGDYGAALASGQRSLAIREKQLGSDHPDVAISLNNMAGLIRAMGDHEKALPLYERSLAIREKVYGPAHPDVANVLNNMALLYGNIGDYSKALSLYERALVIREKTLGPEHPEVATTLDNLGTIYWHLRELGKTAPLMERALAIRVKRFGVEHPDSVTSLNNLAVVYRDMGDTAKARPYYERSVEIMEKTRGPNHPYVATSLNNLAVFYESVGERERAILLYERSLAIREKALGPDHSDVAGGLYNLATLLAREGDKTRPLPMLIRALTIAGNSNAPEIVWPTQNVLRETLAQQGQPDLAIFYGKQAVNTIQLLRARIADLDQSLQKSFVADKAHVYRGLADLLIEQGRLAEAQHVLGMLKEEEFFDFIRRDSGEDPRRRKMEFLTHEQPWHERLAALNARLSKAGAERAELERKAKIGLSDAEKSRLAEVAREQTAAAAELDKYYREVAVAFAALSRGRAAGAPQTPEAAPQLKAMQQLLSTLGAGTALIHFVSADNRLSIVLTTATNQVARQVNVKSADLNQKIERFRASVRNPSVNMLPAGQELYQLLISPIEKELNKAQAKTLMLYLDGALRYIPLAALHDGKQFLVERYALALYTEVTKDNLTTRPSGKPSVAALGLTQRIEGFEPLPAVRQELQGIVKSASGGVLPGEMHFDRQFSAAQLKQSLAKGHPLLHIASHFVFRPGNESTSFLLLGDGDQLSLSRIKQEKFDFRHVDMVTLSACETGVGGGKDAQGQEVEGLGALVQKQGAKGVIATLWPVADESTGRIMQTLYQQRQVATLTKAEALRQAQLEFIQGRHTPNRALAQRGLDAPTGTKAVPAGTNPYTHPYFWAPFILMGNWL